MIEYGLISNSSNTWEMKQLTLELCGIVRKTLDYFKGVGFRDLMIKSIARIVFNGLQISMICYLYMLS